VGENAVIAVNTVIIVSNIIFFITIFFRMMRLIMVLHTGL